MPLAVKEEYSSFENLFGKRHAVYGDMKEPKDFMNAMPNAFNVTFNDGKTVFDVADDATTKAILEKGLWALPMPLTDGSEWASNVGVEGEIDARIQGFSSDVPSMTPDWKRDPYKKDGGILVVNNPTS